jgi:Flp pilus assembly protein TadD
MITQHMPAMLTVILISLGAQTALGAGGDSNYSSAPQKPAGYNDAVALIAAEKYQEAILPLQSAEKSAQNDADIQNLLGFVHRKTGKLDAAGGYYQRALEINPKHKGALEYQGELFLMRGDKDAAEANLAKLDKICWLGCSEYDDLKKAIAESQ